MDTGNNVFEEFLVARLIRDLPKDNDPVRALRSALLGALLLLEDEDRAARRLIDFLLLEFDPLANAFNKHKHHLFGDLEVMRARTEAGDTTLLLPEDSVREQFEKWCSELAD